MARKSATSSPAEAGGDAQEGGSDITAADQPTGVETPADGAAGEVGGDGSGAGSSVIDEPVAKGSDNTSLATDDDESTGAEQAWPIVAEIYNNGSHLLEDRGSGVVVQPGGHVKLRLHDAEHAERAMSSIVETIKCTGLQISDFVFKGLQAEQG